MYSSIFKRVLLRTCHRVIICFIYYYSEEYPLHPPHNLAEMASIELISVLPSIVQYNVPGVGENGIESTIWQQLQNSCLAARRVAGFNPVWSA